ncbi:hypothetical protein ES708_01491 [subsurface metagenome]
MHLTQGAAFNGEILSIGTHGAAVHLSVAGNHGIGGDRGLIYPEVGAVMLDKQIRLMEGIKQEVNPLSGGQLARIMLLLNSLFAAASPGFFFQLF